MNSQKQDKELDEIETRSCNIMIYNCCIPIKELSAKASAETYLKNCNIDSIDSLWRQVVDATFVKVADDGKTGTVLVTMKRPSYVNTILKDAKLLKDNVSKHRQEGDVVAKRAAAVANPKEGGMLKWFFSK